MQHIWTPTKKYVAFISQWTMLIICKTFSFGKSTELQEVKRKISNITRNQEMLNSCKWNSEFHSCWIKTTIVHSFFGHKSKEFPELAHVLSSLEGSNITALHFWPKPIVVLLLCSLLNLPISAYFRHSLLGLVVTAFHVWRKTLIANRKDSWSIHLKAMQCVLKFFLIIF